MDQSPNAYNVYKGEAPG